MLQLLGLILKSKVAKIAGSVVGAGAGLTTILWQTMVWQADQVDAKIKATDKIVREYVDAKHTEVLIEVKHLKSGQGEMKSLLQTIDKRVYDLNKDRRE